MDFRPLQQLGVIRGGGVWLPQWLEAVLRLIRRQSGQDEREKSHQKLTGTTNALPLRELANVGPSITSSKQSSVQQLPVVKIEVDQ